MDAAVDAVVLIDDAGCITGLNRSAERMFGYVSDELLGHNVKVLMSERYASAHDDYLKRYAGTGIPHIIGVGRDVEARRRDGTVFPAFLSVGKVSDTDPPGFVGFVRDVTVERQAFAALKKERDLARISHTEEQEARQLQERLMHVSRMATIGEMASGIAHELNQPLSAIATYARACQRLTDAGATDDPDFRPSLKEIEEEAFRAGTIIQRLRQLASPAAGVREMTDLNELILGVVTLVQADARLHQTEITTDLVAQPVMAVVDREHIQQVILHLLRNAMEATDQVPGTARLVRVTSRLENGIFELRVEDSGPGLHGAMVDRLFMPFFTTKEAGAGLGLVTSQTIVQAHGGKLTFQPSDLGGARFSVSIPLSGVSS